jgi:hypothetical protein
MKAISYASLVLLGSLATGASFAATPQMIGWIEHVSVHPHQLVLKAKIDTGADNSSVHAENINVVENNGTTMVSFTLRNKHGDIVQLEKPLLRYAQIKSKLPGAEPILRPVVELNLCVGNTARKVPVNLSNRENFTYRMLIGRSYLKHGYVVDSSNKHLVEPGCDANSLASNL